MHMFHLPLKPNHPQQTASLYTVRKSKCSLHNKLTQAKHELHLTLWHFSLSSTLSDILTTYVTGINLIISWNTNYEHFVQHEVLTSVVMKSTIFWDITLCSLLKVNRSACKLLSCWYLAQHILQLWRWRWYVPPKCQLIFNALHRVISQKIVFFMKILDAHWFS
jgi:hypothetical protein